MPMMLSYLAHLEIFIDMSRYTKDIDRGLKKFKQELQKAQDVEVLIGIHEGDMNGDETIAEYAAANEFGTDDIPERSFMRETFDEEVADLNIDLREKFKLVQTGKMSTWQALGLVGLKHENQIKAKINSNIDPANSPETIARKKSSKTLIDTGAMLNSVRHVVRKV
jgi:hypothetical protein